MTRGCATHVQSSSRFHHASSDDRDPLRSQSITRTHLDCPNQHLKIGRWIAPHEEPRLTRDRGPIVARSWPDSCAIVVHSEPKWSCSIAESKGRLSSAQLTHDHATIEVYHGRSRRKSWRGRSGNHAKN